jgi:adenosylcobalamin-dependent ribonucleoside-triphosphate reductase
MFLSDSFIDEYKNKEVPFGPLGYVTYKRTYARPVEGENRTEEWYETCRRVIEGNLLLEVNQTKELNIPCRLTKSEAEIMYDDMFHMRWLPPGRGLWCSGTGIGFENGAALTNCYFVEIKPVNGKISYPFQFAMDMLMLGAGVGFSVANDLVSKISKVMNKVNLYVVCDPTHRDFNYLNVDEMPRGTKQYIEVWDSREGWVYALKKVIDSAFLSKTKNPKTLVIDVSLVRPTGESIKSFGGKASGPAPLVEMLRFINKLLNSRVDSKLSDVDCTDIMNVIGRCVVAGNVRRSAMLALGDASSEAFRTMKTYDHEAVDKLNNFIQNDLRSLRKLTDTEFEALYNEKSKSEMVNHHRWASNNSILITDDFDSSLIVDSIIKNGEPGFLNLNLIQNFGRLVDGGDKVDVATGTNPCGEVSLESYEPCNLSEIFPSNCSSWSEILRVAEWAYKYSKRVTLSSYGWEETRRIVEKNRRIGVSLSGIQDWVFEMKDENNYAFETFEEHFSNLLDELYIHISVMDSLYSEYLQINESIKLTTVKPSGTISLLAGVSQGMHWPYAPYYIRSIQFQENDPMVKYCESLGFRTRPSVQTPKAILVEFPIKDPNAENSKFKSAGDVSAKDQLEFQFLLQQNWSDNQVSCTVSFNESEHGELPELINEYSKKLKSTSMLPYFDLGRQGSDIKKYYPDLPMEPISAKEYEKRITEIKEWPKRLVEDGDNFEVLNNEECKGGICPIK